MVKEMAVLNPDGQCVNIIVVDTEVSFEMPEGYVLVEAEDWVIYTPTEEVPTE